MRAGFLAAVTVAGVMLEDGWGNEDPTRFGRSQHAGGIVPESRLRGELYVLACCGLRRIKIYAK